jgi:hypothetical protein
MRSGKWAAALACGCFLALPVLAADKKAASNKPVDADNLPAGDFTGKLTSTPGTDGSFAVNVESDHVELKPGANRSENQEVQQLLRDQQRVEKTQGKLARARNRGEYQRLVRQLAGEMERLQAQSVKAQLKEDGDYTVKKDYKEVDFHAGDDVKVRTMILPVQFDDKGNPKQYSPDELKALKGKDKDLPGYEAKLSDLKVGDQVKVTLAPPKPDKKDGDNADPKSDPNVKPANEVTMIVILSEPTSDGGKKKK